MSQLIVSCSSENDVLSQFSKRKYLKNFKDKNVKYKNNNEKYNNEFDNISFTDNYAAKDIIPEEFNLNTNKKNINGKALVKEIKIEHQKQIELIIEGPVADYSKWNKYNRKIDFYSLNSDNIDIENHVQKNKMSASQVDGILLAIFCIIPPLGVYMYDNDLTTNFWVSIILTLLFWFPGFIFALLVCFDGVSL